MCVPRGMHFNFLLTPRGGRWMTKQIWQVLAISFFFPWRDFFLAGFFFLWPWHKNKATHWTRRTRACGTNRTKERQSEQVKPRKRERKQMQWKIKINTINLFFDFKKKLLSMREEKENEKRKNWLSADALRPSTTGAIVHFLVLTGSLLSITEITEYRYFSPSKPIRELRYRSR